MGNVTIIPPNEKPWQWRQGETGNQAGVDAKLRARVYRYARGKSFKAIQKLAALIDDPKVSPGIQKDAAIALLNRAWGAPKQEVEVSNQEASLAEILLALHEERERRRLAAAVTVSGGEGGGE